MNNIDNLIENLNKEQKEAVLSTEGPNLIVAGAGSGKTKVLTTRLIHTITSIDGERGTGPIRNFVQKEMLAIDSKALRGHITKVMPDIDEKQVGTIAMMEAVRHSDGFRDRILDHMCTVIINTVNEA